MLRPGAVAPIYLIPRGHPRVFHTRGRSQENKLQILRQANRRFAYAGGLLRSPEGPPRELSYTHPWDAVQHRADPWGRRDFYAASSTLWKSLIKQIPPDRFYPINFVGWVEPIHSYGDVRVEVPGGGNNKF